MEAHRPSPPERAPVVAIANIQFSWPRSSTPVIALAALTIAQGERVFLQGPSGSGKSTLLNLIAGVIVPSSGELSVLGHNLAVLSGAQRDRFRADHIGFIFQLFNLIPYLSVIENVCLPCGFSARRRARVAGVLDAEAHRLLRHLDLDDPQLLERPVTELSVGQQQRVAAARALIGAPELIIADEPTSALDADRRIAFLELLFRQCEQERTALVFATHDAALSPLFDRTIELADLQPRARGSAADDSTTR